MPHEQRSRARRTVCPAAGLRLKCRMLFGDLHWATVTWGDQAELGKRVGEPITLRFQLDTADLYGLELE